jgi:hypothetical protein
LRVIPCRIAVSRPPDGKEKTTILKDVVQIMEHPDNSEICIKFKILDKKFTKREDCKAEGKIK